MLNVVHPYTFKFHNGEFIIGEIVEYTERDNRLASLVSTANNNHYSVLCYERSEPFSDAFDRIAIKIDETFNPLFHSNVRWINTDNYGYPLRDENNGEVDDETWDNLTRTTITHSKLMQVIGDPSEIIVCGGEFSRCERNFMNYINTFWKPSKRRFYVPELSIVLDKDREELTREEISNMGFKPISYEKAMEIVS